jgi:hypothetical protein
MFATSQSNHTIVTSGQPRTGRIAEPVAAEGLTAAENHWIKRLGGLHKAQGQENTGHESEKNASGWGHRQQIMTR